MINEKLEWNVNVVVDCQAIQKFVPTMIFRDRNELFSFDVDSIEEARSVYEFIREQLRMFRDKHNESKQELKSNG